MNEIVVFYLNIRFKFTDIYYVQINPKETNDSLFSGKSHGGLRQLYDAIYYAITNTPIRGNTLYDD